MAADENDKFIPANSAPLSKVKQMGYSDGTVAYDFDNVSIYVKDHDGVTSDILQKLGLYIFVCQNSWGCPPSKFPWTYSAKETCYLLKGKVKVYPEGCGDEHVEIRAGDFVVFPKGMSCTWDVSETVDKHYDFE